MIERWCGALPCTDAGASRQAFAGFVAFSRERRSSARGQLRPGSQARCRLRSDVARRKAGSSLARSAVVPHLRRENNSRRVKNRRTMIAPAERLTGSMGSNYVNARLDPNVTGGLDQSQLMMLAENAASTVRGSRWPPRAGDQVRLPAEVRPPASCPPSAAALRTSWPQGSRKS